MKRTKRLKSSEWRVITYKLFAMSILTAEDLRACDESAARKRFRNYCCRLRIEKTAVDVGSLFSDYKRIPVS